MTLFAENFLNERVIMKIRLNKPFFIKGLAVVYAVLMLLILFGRTSYNIGKPYWEQLQLNINLVPFYTISQYLGQFTRNYTQTVKRAADNKRRYAPGEGSIPPVLLSGVSKGVPPLAHDFACKV